MAQTADGFLWFGTFNGLVRFDGLKFTVFNRFNTPALPDNNIVNLHLDRQGRLWVSTSLGLVVRETMPVESAEVDWRTLTAQDGWKGDLVRSFAERPNGDLLLTRFDGEVLEQLLKARVLTALCTVRSERLFCEQLGYHLLWLWFLDREFSEGSFNHSVFAKNYERVLSADVAKLFFAEVYDLSRQEGWTSDEHFTADGTLIESWASLKSFVRKDGGDAKQVQSAKYEYPGNSTLNFHGETRRNDALPTSQAIREVS